MKIDKAILQLIAECLLIIGLAVAIIVKLNLMRFTVV